MECSTLCIITAFLAYIVYNLVSRLLRIPSVGRYNDRYILVTGCDTGFGHEIAKRLDRLGCHVFAGCLTEKGETELKKTSQRLHTISLDVTSDKSVRAAFKYVTENLPPGRGLWAVLNNAGITGAGGRLEWLTIDNYKEVAAVNLYGVIDVTMTFLPLVKKERGRIVNTSSVAGRFSFPVSLPYCVAKYGVEAFTDGLRRSLRPYKCKAILIEPGAHATNMASKEGTHNMFQRGWNQAIPDIKKEFGEEFFKQMVETSLELIKNVSDRTSDVIDAYEHALLGRCPRARYVVGFDANFILIPLQALPEWLGDWVLEKLGGKVPVPDVLKK